MENFVKVECYKCGIVFAVSTALESCWKRYKTIFYCPNGDAQSYSKTTADELKEKLERMNGELFRTQIEKNRLEKENIRLSKRIERKK